MTAGVRQIVRFNWPYYAAASTASAVIVSATARFPISRPMRGAVCLAAASALVWMIGSLAASWLVYDRSRLMRWRWISQALGFRPRAWINIHAGLDQSTPALLRMFGTRGRVFDVFDPVEMTERSIVRARRLARNAIVAEQVAFRTLDAARGSADAVFLLLSAHEFRTHAGRLALFSEIHRTVAPGGRVVVAEHLRDLANFAAFGPGVLHFHSRRTWLRCFHESDFAVEAEFSITPFVRIFVLRHRQCAPPFS